MPKGFIKKLTAFAENILTERNILTETKLTYYNAFLFLILLYINKL